MTESVAAARAFGKLILSGGIPVASTAAPVRRRPTATAVERRLGIPHATFHRNFADLVDAYFRPRAARLRDEPPPIRDGDSADKDRKTLERLRRENTDLRKLVQLYEEAIRQLTVDNHALTEQAECLSGVTRLDHSRTR